MAKKGFFRRITEATAATVKRVADPIKRVAAAPFKSKAKPAQKKPAAKRTPTIKPKPTPAVAREQLQVKLQDMYWLQRKWDAAATSKRISKMTDAQVYAALDMSENDIETEVRKDPRRHPEWAAPDDPNSNILWYHGGEH